MSQQPQPQQQPGSSASSAAPQQMAATQAPQLAQTTTTGAPAVQTTGNLRRDFFFRRRDGMLNWRQIANVDLESVVRNVDVAVLQENIEHVTFADLTEADLEQVNYANFIQLFRICQLVIEYLLNVQNYFMNSDQQKDAYIDAQAQEIALLKKQLKRKDDKAKQAQKELRSAKKLIKAYKAKAKKRGNSSARKKPVDAGATAHACKKCSSHFAADNFLQAHYTRRHPGFDPNAVEKEEARPAVGTRDIDFGAFVMDEEEPEVEKKEEVKTVQPATRDVDLGFGDFDGEEDGDDTKKEAKEGPDVAELVKEVVSQIKTQEEEQLKAIQDKLAAFEAAMKQNLLDGKNNNRGVYGNGEFMSMAGQLRDDESGLDDDNLEDERFNQLHKSHADAQAETQQYLKSITDELQAMKDEKQRLLDDGDPDTNPTDEDLKRIAELERLKALSKHDMMDKQYAPYADMPFLHARYPHPRRKLTDMELGLRQFVDNADETSVRRLARDIDHMRMGGQHQRVQDDLDYIMHAHYKPSSRLRKKLNSIADLEAALADRRRSPAGHKTRRRRDHDQSSGDDEASSSSSEAETRKKRKKKNKKKKKQGPVTRVLGEGAIHVKGSLTVTIVSGHSLTNADTFGKQDPYCVLKMGKEKFRTKTHKKGGLNPVWEQSFVMNLNTDDARKDVIHFNVFDEDAGGDDFIGMHNITLAEFLQRPATHFYTLMNKSVKKPKVEGRLLIKTVLDQTDGVEIPQQAAMFIDSKQRYVAPTQGRVKGQLSITVKRGINLTNEDIGKQDPYVVIKLKGEVFKTKVIKNGGSAPVWNETKVFDVNTEHINKDLLQLTVWDSDLGMDDTVGITTLALSDVIGSYGLSQWNIFKKGSQDKLTGLVEVVVEWTQVSPEPEIYVAPLEEKQYEGEIEVPLTGKVNGTLSVTVHRAVDLKSVDIGAQDPYVILKMGKEKFQTKTHKKGGAEPVWEQTYGFNVATDDISKEVLQMEVWDDDLGMDDSIGKARLDLLTLLSNVGTARRYAVYNSAFKKVHGRVELTIKWTQQLPAPVPVTEESEYINLFKETPQGYDTPTDGKVTGRLTITVDSGVGLKNMDIGKQDPYCVLRLGKEKFKTKTHKKGGENPVWHQSFAFNVDVEDLSKETLGLELWDDDMGMDDQIGRIQLDLVSVLQRKGAATLPVYDGSNYKKIHGHVNVKFDWKQTFPVVARTDSTPEDAIVDVKMPEFAGLAGAVEGRLTVTVIKGTDLKNMDSGKQDPYCVLKLGKKKYKTKVHKKAGAFPTWNESFVFDVKTAEASKEVLHVTLWDDDFGMDDEIGRNVLDLATLALRKEVYRFPVFDASYKKIHGHCEIQVEWEQTTPAPRPVPATQLLPERDSTVRALPLKGPVKGVLTLTAHRGVGLKNMDSGKQDPYMKLQVGKEKFKTNVHKLGGSEPIWNKAFAVNLDVEEIQQSLVSLEVWDDDALGDDSIGKASLDLRQLLAFDGVSRYPVFAKFKTINGYVDIGAEWKQEYPEVPKPVAAPAQLESKVARGGRQKAAEEEDLTLEDADAADAGPVFSMEGPVEGELTLTIHRGIGLKSMDTFAKQDPYAVVKIGSEKYKTQIHKKGGKNPVWDETYTFTVNTNDISTEIVHLQLWDHDAGMDDSIGRAEIPLIKLVRKHEAGATQYAVLDTGKMSKVHGHVELSSIWRQTSSVDKNVTTTRNEQKTRTIDPALAVTGAVKGRLTIKFTRAFGLKNEDTGKQDPYVVAKIGKEKFRSSTHKGGGQNPIWVESNVFNVETKDITKEILSLSIFDEDAGLDDLVGKARLDLLDLIGNQGSSRFPVFSSNFKKVHGEIELNIDWKQLSPALLSAEEEAAQEAQSAYVEPLEGPAQGMLTIKVKRGIDMKNMDYGQQDPYCKITVGEETKRTKTIKKGGSNVTWNETFDFAVDSKDAMTDKITVSIYDDDAAGDDLVGLSETVLGSFLAKTGVRRYPIFETIAFVNKHGEVELEITWSPLDDEDDADRLNDTVEAIPMEAVQGEATFTVSGDATAFKRKAGQAPAVDASASFEDSYADESWLDEDDLHH